MFATNLKKHLQNKHKNSFEECDTAEKARGANNTRKEGKSQVPSTQLQEIIESTMNGGKESSRHTAITKKLSIFVGATNAPFSVSIEEFHELLHEMNGKYQVPHRKRVSERSARYTIIYKKQFDSFGQNQL